MTYRINNLTPVMYSGWNQRIEHNDGIDAPCRMTAFDFPGEAELFRLQCAELQLLWHAIPDAIRGGSGSKEVLNQHSEIMITRAIDNINHKLIQLGAIYPALLSEVLESDRQSNELAKSFGEDVPRFESFIPMRRVEAEVEHFLYRVLSILDVCALLARYFNADAPAKFGHQIAQTKQSKVWDQVYQQYILQLEALEACRGFRNSLSHEVSLKLRPAKINGQWQSVMVKDFGDSDGLVVAALLPQAKHELWGLIRFIDRHFAEKAPSLLKLWPDNRL